MAIIMNQVEQVITLQTKRSTYQMKVGDYGVLLHLYYGARVEDCTMDYLLHKKDVGFSGNPYDAGEDRTFSLDTLPQEFPSYGVGDYRNTWVCARRMGHGLPISGMSPVRFGTEHTKFRGCPVCLTRTRREKLWWFSWRMQRLP